MQLLRRRAGSRLPAGMSAAAEAVVKRRLRGEREHATCDVQSQSLHVRRWRSGMGHDVRLVGFSVISLAMPLWADEGHHHALTQAEVGSVNFPNSCSPNVKADLTRAVALLHSFQYEQSRQAFEAVVKKDSQCAMAEWGVAMSHYHGLWKNG